MQKAESVLEVLRAGQSSTGERLQSTGFKDVTGRSEVTLVIAADTIVYAEGVIGKPHDHQAAVDTLLKLKGRWHTVLTAVALIELSNEVHSYTESVNDSIRRRSFTDRAYVLFSDYSLEEIETYIETEPPYDKAGSYGIQGIWGHQVKAVHGDIDTVKGLPYQRLAELYDW